MKTLLNLHGQRFGSLTVIGTESGVKGRRRRFWLCKCDCGNVCNKLQDTLRKGNAKSCGCIKRKQTIERFTTHGLTDSRAYEIWCGMKKRCSNPKSRFWTHYGGRGIRVCDRWGSSFANFFADMGHPPDGMTIDRIDNDGDYEPRNCQWATRLVQSRNTRRNIHLTWRGKTQCVSGWAQELGIPYRFFRYTLGANSSAVSTYAMLSNGGGFA